MQRDPWVGVDHDGLRAQYLRYVEQTDDRSATTHRGRSIHGLPFSDWLLAQPTAYLFAFGVKQVEDVKLAIAGWRQWARKMRVPDAPR